MRRHYDFSHALKNPLAEPSRRRVRRVTGSIPNSRTPKRRPIHPGEILREDFLPDYGLTVTSLAAAVRVSRSSMTALLRERRALTAEMAVRLGRLFGNSPGFWLNLQRGVDLWDATQGLKRELARIRPLRA